MENPSYVVRIGYRYFSQALQVVTNALRRHVENAELHYYQGNFFKDLNNMQQAKKVRTRNFSS